MTKRKPLYWRAGKGEWHEETLTGGVPLRAMSDAEVAALIGGCYPLRSLCFPYSSETGKRMTSPDVQTRRSAPPVADQCKGCRAAKAKEVTQ